MCNHDYIFAVEVVPMASKQESWDFKGLFILRPEVLQKLLSS